MTKKPNENSLKNLQLCDPQKTFLNSDVARAAQLKSAAKRKENKLLKEVAAEKLQKCINGVPFQEFSINKLIEYTKTIDADPEKVLKILAFLRDTSGQKPKDEVQAVVLPLINIKGL